MTLTQTTPDGVSRRGFPGYVVGAPTLVMALGSPAPPPAHPSTTSTDADLDEIRNVCRCGTYSRIREAIKAGAQDM